MCFEVLHVPGMNGTVGPFRWTKRLVNISVRCLVIGVCVRTKHQRGFVSRFSGVDALLVTDRWRIETYDRSCCTPLGCINSRGQFPSALGVRLY